MIEGREDRVYEKYKKRSDGFLERMRKLTKNVKPAFQEPIKPIDRLYAFDQMTEQDVQRFITEQPEAFMQEILEVDKIRRRLGGKNAPLGSTT